MPMGFRIMAIPTQWKRLVEIFLDNALKYSSAGGKTQTDLREDQTRSLPSDSSKPGRTHEEGQLNSLF